MRRVFALLLIGLAGVVTAADPPPSPKAAPAVTPPKHGYWFYQEPPKPEDAPPEAIVPEAVKVMPPPPPKEVLLQMPVEQVSRLITDYRQYALHTMKPEHVTWYFQMQDFARLQSRAFMNVTQMVMLQNPSLNMNTEYPTNVPGTNARVAQFQKSIDERLDRERGQAALVLLTSQGCAYCEAQRGILKYFQQKHGWDVAEIDIQERPEVAARFATSYTPTTVVIFRGTESWFPVAVGVETLPKVEENTYAGVRQMRGESTPEQFTLKEYQEGGMLDPNRR